jgi:hypothetical protein
MSLPLTAINASRQLEFVLTCRLQMRSVCGRTSKPADGCPGEGGSWFYRGFRGSHRPNARTIGANHEDQKDTMTVVAAAAIAAVGTGSAPTASAYFTTNRFGTSERLYDAGGSVVTAWTIRDLEPSRDTVPDHPLAGKLWQATATVNAVRGTVTPIIPDLNARANDGQNYQVLWQAFTPNGISGATLPQGGRSSGKIYFDVTGQAPARVVYNNGVQDLLMWGR